MYKRTWPPSFVWPESSEYNCFSAALKFAGTIPGELEGTLLRNGPGLLEIGGKPLSQPLDGDGMVRMSALMCAVHR